MLFPFGYKIRGGLGDLAGKFLEVEEKEENSGG
jgi:hypothetical protein